MKISRDRKYKTATGMEVVILDIHEGYVYARAKQKENDWVALEFRESNGECITNVWDSEALALVLSSDGEGE